MPKQSIHNSYRSKDEFSELDGEFSEKTSPSKRIISTFGAKVENDNFSTLRSFQHVRSPADKDSSVASQLSTFSPKTKHTTDAVLRSKNDPRTFCPKFGTELPASKIATGRKRERSIYTWLRNRTSSLDYGKEIKDAKGPCEKYSPVIN